MILAWMICILMIAGLLCWLLAQWNPLIAKWIALLSVITNFILIGQLCLEHYARLTDPDPWFINYQAQWIPSFGISFHMAMDGLSAVMVLLSFFWVYWQFYVHGMRSKQEPVSIILTCYGRWPALRGYS